MMRSVQISLQQATPSDYEDMISLLKSAELPVIGVSEHVDNFLVARNQVRDLVGVAGLEVYGESGLLRSVAVTASHRGEGVGHMLVERSIRDAKGKGVRRLYLLTETAEKFMQRFGFKRVGRESVDSAVHASEEFKAACSETAVTMLLEL